MFTVNLQLVYGYFTFGMAFFKAKYPKIHANRLVTPDNAKKDRPIRVGLLCF